MAIRSYRDMVDHLARLWQREGESEFMRHMGDAEQRFFQIMNDSVRTRYNYKIHKPEIDETEFDLDDNGKLTIWNPKQYDSALTAIKRAFYPATGGFETTPTDGQIILRNVAAQNYRILPDFEGLAGSCDVNPSSAFLLTVTLNDALIGNIMVSQNGTVHGTTLIDNIQVRVDDVLKVIAPANTFGAEGFGLTLRGEI